MVFAASWLAYDFVQIGDAARERSRDVQVISSAHVEARVLVQSTVCSELVVGLIRFLKSLRRHQLRFILVQARGHIIRKFQELDALLLLIRGLSMQEFLWLIKQFVLIWNY